MRFLKQVLYSEKTIPLKQGAPEQSLKEQQDILQTRRQAEIEKHKDKAVFEDYLPD